MRAVAPTQTTTVCSGIVRRGTAEQKHGYLLKLSGGTSQIQKLIIGRSLTGINALVPS